MTKAKVPEQVWRTIKRFDDGGENDDGDDSRSPIGRN